MDQSAEIGTEDMAVIRSQMDETRTALAQKLGRLERQVTDTVQGAAQSVGDTVENVKHAVEDTMNTMKTSVRETVDAVGETVHAVGEAVSIKHHVERHPWAMVAGATAVGFVGGYMLMHKSTDQRADERFRHLAASQGRMPQPDYDSRGYTSPIPHSNRAPTPVATQSMRGDSAPNAFNEWLKPATTQIQALAVGTALGLFRDFLTQAVPKPVAGQVKELIDGLTTSLGGQIIRGSLLEQFSTPPKSNQQN